MTDSRNFTLSVPLFASSNTLDKESALRDLAEMGADRVLLAIDFLTHDQSIMEGYYRTLSEAIPFFQKNGLEVGVWFWAFRFQNEEPRYTVAVNANGVPCHTTTVKYCPFDEGYLAFMEEHVRRLAAMHPDLILFDDDLSFGFTSMDAPACFCALHRKHMASLLGEPVPSADGLYKTMFSGKPNRYRTAFLKANGDALRTFALRMRAAVDDIDPDVRMGACGCITTFDYDGTDSFTLSRLLAGNTKPFLRLIGAPYWDPVRLHGNYLCDVIELERMERAWYDGKDMEIVSEGDTYPRPRHRVPASYLELFDAALRADGNFGGIMKYAFCYQNHADYERGYLNAHRKDQPDMARIRSVFSGLSDAGVRIYESMKKIESSDYSHDVLDQNLIRYQFFSRAVRFLSHNSIPAAHRGTGCAGIVFGENARTLPDEALARPLILDEHAARILQERGIDVGAEAIGERVQATMEYYEKTDEYEAVTDYRLKPRFASRITPKATATLQSEWLLPSGERIPASYTYRNADGQVFLVLCADAFTCPDELYKNYSRQKQFLDFLEESGAALPVRCEGNPDLYVLAKESEDTLAVGLFNCFADAVEPLTLTLSVPAAHAEFFRCTGTCEGNTLRIEHLSAFDWCFVKIQKNRS